MKIRNVQQSDKTPKGEAIRKLVAVMFADIEGYTHLFQHNEAAAIRQVEDHREDVMVATSIYHGNVMQFYGDGSLTVFDSIVDAIQCAVEIQRLSALHRIPIRIGIHYGDIVFKGGDIYGDSVNIASRIQTLGIAGSILISDKVAAELHNHPEISILPLGSFALKNVRSRMPIFAISGEGLAIPKIEPTEMPARFDRRSVTWLLLMAIAALVAITARRWFVLSESRTDEIVYVIPPFTAYKSDDAGETGQSASSYITHVLNQSSDAKVISLRSLLRYTDADLASISNQPKLATRFGASMSINGSYLVTGQARDSFLMWVSLQNLRDEEKAAIALPEVKCPTSNEVDCYIALLDNLRGYLKQGNRDRFRHTNIQAHNAFVKAVKLWDEPGKAREIRSALREAIQHDPTFLDAYFLLLEDLNASREFQSEADTLNLIRILFDDLSEREENRMLFFQSDLDGKKSETFYYWSKEADRNPDDLSVVTEGMVLATEYLNDPLTTIRLFNRLQLDTVDLNKCSYCQTSLNQAIRASLDLGNVNMANQLAEKLQPISRKSSSYSRLIDVYLYAKDTIRVDKIIKAAAQQRGDRQSEAFYNLVAAKQAYVLGEYDLVKHFVRRILSFPPEQNHPVMIANAYLLLGENEKALESLEKFLSKYPDHPYIQADAGVIYARLGRIAEAEEAIKVLDAQKKTYNFGVFTYLKARIKANLGDRDDALALLEQALEEGRKFEANGTFLRDPLLVVMNTDERYIKLLGKYRVSNP